MKKSLLTLAVLSTLSSSVVFADEAAAPAAEAKAAPPYTVAYNVGLFSQYIFRGLTQTQNKLAVQGGVDFTHSSGFYAGAWGSNVSWLEDARSAAVDSGTPGVGYDNSSLELDLYGGYRGTVKEVGYDIGLLQYVYPGTPVPGAARAETTEVYGSLSYKWVTAKLSVAVSDKVFANRDAAGTYYADLTANYPLTDTITLTAHVGRQEYSGSANDPYSYTDWKLGASKVIAEGVTVGGYYTDTNAKELGYGAAVYKGGNIGDAQGTVFIQKTF
jgi:uncharacterized protein (TIGR02001 family)